MSFTPYNQNQGGMPDISAKMIQSGNIGNYESQGIERAVIIDQNGLPMGNIQEVPPYDLLTEENRHRVENSRRIREAKRIKKQNERNKPAQVNQPIENQDDVLQSIKRELLNKRFQYITQNNFGTEVLVVSCEMKDGEIQITMDDGVSISFNDIESKFIPVSDRNLEIMSTLDDMDEIQSQPIVPVSRKENSQVKEIPQTYKSELPISPLQELLKTRKKNLTPISIAITIDLVKKDFFKIIDDSYDNAIDYVVEHIMSGVTIDDVKKSIKNELELYYKSDSRSLVDDEFENKKIYKEPETIILEKTE